MVHIVTESAARLTGRAIRAELVRRNLKREDLAEAFGWSPSTMGRRLSGSIPFNVDELARVADFLGVPPSALVSDKEVA